MARALCAYAAVPQSLVCVDFRWRQPCLTLKRLDLKERDEDLNECGLFIEQSLLQQEGVGSFNSPYLSAGYHQTIVYAGACDGFPSS